MNSDVQTGHEIGEKPMPFHTFVRKPTPPEQEAWATLQSRGYLSFDPLAYEKMGSPSHVKLLYDAERRLIGVQGVAAGDLAAYPVRLQTKSRLYVLSIKSFLSFFEIQLDHSRRYTVKFDGQRMLIDLDGESTLITGPRAKSESE
jgi:hypothetical protein